MAIIRFTEPPHFRNPWAEFERLRRGLDQLSRNYPEKELQYSGANVFPPLNMYEDSETLIVKAEIPGVGADDLEISLVGDTLTIQGTRKGNQIDEQTSYHRREIEQGNFSRAVSLPTKVNPDKVTAKLKNGILTVTIDKAAEVKPRQVKIVTE